MYSTRGLILLALASVASLQTIQVPPSVVCVCVCVYLCVSACMLPSVKRRPECTIKRDLPAARRSVCGNKRASTEGAHSDAVC